MLTPEYIRDITNKAANSISRLYTNILKRIVAAITHRLKRGDDYILTPKDKYMIEAMQDAGKLYSDIIKDIAKATPYTEKEMHEAFTDAMVENIKYDEKVYEDAGLESEDGLSPKNIRVLQRVDAETQGTFINLCKVTADASQQYFIQKIDEAYDLVHSGGMSLEKVVRDTVGDLAQNGIRFVSYKNHKDTIETAVLRALRTAITQTAGFVSMQRLEEMDWDIILVSAHLGARCYGEGVENHEKWQGKFYTRTGKNPQFEPFIESTGYGTIEGLCGVNCRHSFGPGDGKNNPYDSLKIDTEENKKAYDLSQKQRAMERNIRKAKRDFELYSVAGETDDAMRDKAQQLKKHISEKNKEYRAFCEENGLKVAQDRLYVSNNKINTVETKHEKETKKGKFIIEETDQDKLKDPVIINDIRVAKVLQEKYGGDITVLKEVDGTKMVDYILNGQLWENKQPKTLNAIEKRFKKANQQIREAREYFSNTNDAGVVIDIAELPKEYAKIETIKRLAQKKLVNVQTVLVISGSEILFEIKL